MFDAEPLDSRTHLEELSICTQGKYPNKYRKNHKRMIMTRIGVLGSGDVGKVLAAGYAKHGHDTRIGTRTVAKLAEWAKEHPKIQVQTFGEVAAASEVLILAVAGWAAKDCLDAVEPASLRNKIVIDATNPLKKDATFPPVGGVLMENFFTKNPVIGKL